MPKSLTVEVEPNVLRWLRERAGWEIEEVSKKLKTTPEAVIELESGKRLPTLRQIKVLSVAFKRPIALFFVSKPREERPLPKDYRFLPIKKDVFDKKTILAIRKSRNLQETAKELFVNMGLDTKPYLDRTKISENPDLIAARYREIFKLDLEKQRKFKDAYKLFGYLRDLIEESDILVFQFSMPIEDARGFALADEFPAVIVVNSRDSIEARLFTLMHEFAHVLLGDTVVDIPEPSTAIRDEIEKWCNTFSSSFLLPTNSAKELFDERLHKLTDTETLNSLSKKYKVSKSVLLFKMLSLNYISRAEVKGVLDRYTPLQPKIKSDHEKKTTGIAQDRKILSEFGNKFVSLVADNFDSGLITYTDALDYLSVKSKNFEKVLAKAKR